MSHRKDTDYLSVSARIRAMENRLLTRERMDRMIDAADDGEARKVLAECGYPEGGSLDQALAAARADVFRDMESAVPDPRLVEIFQLKYDYHNGKTLLKAAAMGRDPQPILLPGGRYDPAELTEGWRREELRGCSPAFQKAMTQAKALLEEESPERNVHVFNSCSAAGGEVLIALKIRELASTGMPFKRGVREVEQYIYQLQTLFVLESLENLRKNGRLTRVQSVVTGALRIKLFMGATPEGEICKLGQALSVKQALGKLVDRIAADPDHKGRTVAISHCNNVERAFQVKQQIQEKCQAGQVLILDAGGITTVYANDGGIVVAY